MKVSIDNQIIIVLKVLIVDMIKYIHKLKIKIICVLRTQIIYLEYHLEHVWTKKRALKLLKHRYMHESNSTNSEKQRVHISFS